MRRVHGRAPYLIHRLRASFWFLPGLMAVAAFAVAVASLSADAAGVSDRLRALGVLFAFEKDSARSLLSTLAGAMVTVVSLVFSLTLVTLTVAAGNLGARLLDRYMQNAVTQATMGLFAGTFVFTVMVLSSIGTKPVEVPALSVVLALLMSIASIAWLMYGFHDLARSLQIDQAASEIARSLRRRIRDAAARRDTGPAADIAALSGEPSLRVDAGDTGYVESIDWQALGVLARGRGLQFDVEVAQGAYVTPLDTVVAVHGDPGADPDLEERVRAAILVGRVRTEADDMMFLVHLLVEIACRALSPGVNDLYTALACADHLCGCMVEALRHGLVRRVVRGDDGRILVCMRSADVRRMAATSLATLRRNGVGNTTFALRLIRNLERLAPAARGHPTEPLFLEHLELISEHALAATPEVDRAAVGRAVARARKAFTAEA